MTSSSVATKNSSFAQLKYSPWCTDQKSTGHLGRLGGAFGEEGRQMGVSVGLVMNAYLRSSAFITTKSRYTSRAEKKFTVSKKKGYHSLPLPLTLN